MLNQKPLAALSSLITLIIFFSGCTSLKTNLSKESNPIVQIEPSHNIRIKNVNIKHLDDSVVITGYAHYRNKHPRIKGHIDYAIISSDGSILDQGRGIKNIKLGRLGRRVIRNKYFQIKLPNDYTDNGQIYIGFHINERKANIPAKCENGIFG